MNKLELIQITAEPDPTADSARANPPALPALTYQGGKYAPTIQRMLASLAEQDALVSLNRDAADDWSIALLYAWSVATDVLGFYQERITNEGYLRTATERRSVLAFARALGYDWRPGLAANVDLALTVTPDAQGQPQRVKLAKGSAVQSTPVEQQLSAIAADAGQTGDEDSTTERKQPSPQIFETSADAEARTEWNLLLPYVGLNAPAAGESEPFSTTLTSLRVANYRTDLQKEDLILLVDQALPDLKPTAAPAWVLGLLDEVAADPQKPYTIIRWKIAAASGDEIQQPALFVFRQKATLFPYAKGVVYFDSETKADEPPPSTPKVAQWTPRTLSLPNLDINTFIANREGSAVFAGTKRDLFRSLDNGESWQPVGLDPVGRNVTALTLDAKGNLLAGSSTGGVYLSYDNGDNWTPVSGDSVAPDIKVTKDAQGNTFTVDPPKTLPKSPILTLEFGDKKLYALAGESVFESTDSGKTWDGLQAPANALPATVQRPNVDEQRKAMLIAAKGLLAVVGLQGLEKIASPIAAGLGSTKWFGLDLWDFLRTKLNPMPPGASTVRALAVATQGKKDTVVIGTDAGKFTVKEKTRRWLVATVIVLLVLFQQFVLHHNQLAPTAFEISGQGDMTTRPTPAPGKEGVTTSVLVSQGTISFAPNASINTGGTYNLHLTSTGTIPVRVDQQQKRLSAAGKLTFSAAFSKDKKIDTLTSSPPMTLAAFTALTTTLAPTLETAGTIFAMTTTKAVSMNLGLDAQVIITPAHGIWPPLISISDAHFTGALEPASPLPEDKRAPWLEGIWQQTADLLQTTYIASWNGIKGFLTDLWAALPDWLKALLTPLNEHVIQPAIRIIDTYLIKPLLNYTAATLLEICYVTLAVLAFLLAWIYADHKMSNRTTVRLESPVNTLAVHSNGQIFAGTKQGVYRSLADDPNAAWWTKATQLLLRRAFPDVPMEPINTGLTYEKTDPPPDIRTLCFTNQGALLAGAANGRIFRLSDPLGELDAKGQMAAKGKVRLAARSNPKPATPATPNTPSKPLVKWERYDQGVVEADQKTFKSSLKGVRAITLTPVGQFVTGGMGSDKVEDRWFTAQVRTVENGDKPKLKLGEIDLDNVYPDLQPGSWLVLRQAFPAEQGQGTPQIGYARYQVREVQRVRSLDFVTVGEFTRAIVEADERLTTFSRTQAQVLIKSESVDLFDHRPVQGKTLYLKGYIPDLNAGHRLIVKGKQKFALVTEPMQDALVSDNGLEQQDLAKGELLRVMAIPEVVGAVDRSATHQRPLRVQRWRLQTRAGFVGTVKATEEQIHWVLPPETEPEVSEGVTVARSEFMALADEADLQVSLDYTYARVTLTKVELQTALTRVYDRATVTVLGNIIPATHGQTIKDEVLGSGSGMQANERFMLQQRPLTYIGTTNEPGYQGEITVKVNDIEWQPVRYLYGLKRDQRAYTVRQDALDNTYITFGNGKEGARLPTGTEQITATYRIGIGPEGNAPAYTIDQPQTMPAAVQQVTNPLPASGGVGPDTPDDVREHTPLSVRIMDRIVALSDYEDYIRLYPGIGRVQLRRFDSGPNLLLHFTVADSAGEAIAPDPALLTTLQKSIDQRRAVAIPRLQIAYCERRYFNLETKVLIEPAYKGRVAMIEQTAFRKLRKAFGFAAREFGQAVAASEVVALLQTIPGVVAVDNVGLRYSDDNTTGEPLTADVATRNAKGEIQPAQLLLLNPGSKGIDLQIAPTDEPTLVLNRHEGAV
ncbi:MAG: putative baseplate assembly protein [Caldilineaceae bacterium]